MPSTSIAIPAPTGGWNARDALDLMEASDAIRMENIFPETTSVNLRRGFRIHTPQSVAMGSGAVQTLHEYAPASGNRQLLAATNNKWWNCTTYNADGTDITNATAITVNKWQCINFRASGTSYMIAVNGTDQPRLWDGTTMTDATYTDAGLSDDANLIHVTSHKGRVYLVEKDTTKVWYVETAGAATGAVDAFDVGTILKRGGYVQSTASWSRDGGNGTEDLFAIISSMGEVLLYSGSYPAGTDWALVSRFLLPSPLGRRSAFQMDADLCIITQQGVIPMSQVLSGGDITQTYQRLTDKISNAFNAVARDYGSNFGWEACIYPKGHMLVVNVPIVENSETNQYVMNLLTGAWCKFRGMTANCWALLNDSLYFAGTGGRVYQADYGTSDNSAAIPFKLKTAFNYCEDREHTKLFGMARPIVTGSEGMSFTFNVDVDFDNRVIDDTATIASTSTSEWDVAEWDVASWGGGDDVVSRSWYSVNGLGRCLAFRLEGNAEDVALGIASFHVTFEPGGLL